MNFEYAHVTAKNCFFCKGKTSPKLFVRCLLVSLLQKKITKPLAGGECKHSLNKLIWWNTRKSFYGGDVLNQLLKGVLRAKERVSRYKI
jgi:hypothetical protein